MNFLDRFLEKYFYKYWLERVVRRTAKKLRGKWIFINLDDDLDRRVLEVAKRAGRRCECSIMIFLKGFNDDQSHLLSSSSSKFAEVVAELERGFTQFRIYWEDSTQTLVVDAQGTSHDTLDWFELVEQAIPHVIAAPLGFDATEVSKSLYCCVRPVQRRWWQIWER